MAETKPGNSLKWYLMYSAFSLFIIIGVFAIMNSYADSIKSHLSVITFKTIEELANPNLAYTANPALPNTIGYILLIIFGIAGFLFTKFLYERQVRQHV